MSNGAVFPPRNLPGPGDNWGRHVQDRIIELERSVEIQNSTVGNQGRSNSGALTVLGRQVDTIANQQTQISAVVSALPVPQAATGSSSVFTVNNSWQTRASVTFTVPPGKTTATITANGLGNLFNNGEFGEAESNSRILIGSSTGRAFPGARSLRAFAWSESLSSLHAATLPVSGTVTVQLQMTVGGNPSGYNAETQTTYAAVSAIAIFS